MKITVIHNLYEKNPYVNESVQYNIIALEDSNVDYQYILFNDKGDPEIYQDVENLLNDKVIYHYSEKNFGEGKCSGGWVGAIPLIEGDIIHNTGQDDVFVKEFYQEAIKTFKNPEIMFWTCNGMKTDGDLNQTQPVLDLRMNIDYSKPLDRWKEWFGVSDVGVDPWFKTSIPKNEVTRANNMMAAPGTLYRKELHDIIGPPSVSDFLGACDFEYWARMLFYEMKGKYEPSPLWMYRVSDISLSIQAKETNSDHRPPYMEKIKSKYLNLWKEKTQ